MATPATLPAEFFDMQQLFDTQKQAPETLPAEFFDDPINAQPARGDALPTKEQFDTAYANTERNLQGTARTLAQRRASIASEPPVTVQDFKQFATSPSIPISKLAPENPTSVAGGIAKGAAQFAEGMTSPMNVALMGLPIGEAGAALGKIGQYLPRAISGAFSLDMLHSAYQQYPEVKAAIDKQDWPGAAAAITKAGLTGGMGVTAGVHAARGAASAPPTASEAAESARAGAEALHNPETLPADFNFENKTAVSSAPVAPVTPARLPADFNFDKGLQDPNRRVSGSVNIPLNEQGRGEMAGLAQKTAGQFTRIEHAPNDRAGESAQIIQQANPQAQVIPAEGLKPWQLGEHEGQPVETEKDAIASRIRDTPEEAPPGGHDQSTAPGEPFDAAQARTVQHVQDQAANIQPDEKVLNIASGRTLRIVDSWLKNGAPEDGSIDTDHMTRDGEWHDTGDLFRAEPGGLKPVENANQPGIYYARHGATDWNGDTKPAENQSYENTGQLPAAPEALGPRSQTIVFADGETRTAPSAKRWLTQDETARTASSLGLPLDEVERAATLPYAELEALSQKFNDQYTAAVRAGTSVRQIADEELDTRAGLYSNLAQRAARAEPLRNPVEARPPEILPAVGRDTSIAVPGEQTKYPARYAVRELADVQPSHNPFNFEPNPAYEYTNDRDYSRAGNAARVVQQSSKGTFDPAYLTTDAPTAEHGTPVIDANGNALGGNSRTMTLARVYERGGEDATAYRDSIKAKADQFGIDPTEVDRFQKPVLVRELGGGVDAQKAITDFNKAAAAELTPEERAVSDGRRLSPETITDIAGRLQDQGEGGSLADALRGENGAGVIQNLVRDGVLTEQEKGGYLDDKGNLTPEAKSRVAKALVGRLFDNPAQFRETTPAMRGKLERIAPQVLRVEGREDWALTDPLREAVGLVEDARVHRQPVEDVARQTNVEGRQYSPESAQLAKTLEQTPTRAAASFRRYANDEALSREGSQSSFFKPPTREEAFGDAFAPATAVGERGAFSTKLIPKPGETYTEWNRRAHPLPDAPPIPQGSNVPYVRTDDGAIYAGTPADYSHIKMAERMGIPPERIREGGFINRGVIDDQGSKSANVNTWADQKRAQSRVDFLRLRNRDNGVTLGGGLGSLQEPYEKFVEQDLKPVAKRVASDLVEAKDQALRLVAPTLRGEAAELMGLSLRQRMAQFARRFDQGEMRLRAAERFFNQRSPEENYKFIDDIEHNRATGDANLDAIAGTFRRMLDQRRREVQDLGEGELERFYTHYFPHIFERAPQAEGFVKSFFGRRTMEGPKSFLKHREFPTFKEALEAGQKPVSDNPVRLVLMKAREMDRYLLAHNVLRDMAERGVAKRLMRGSEAGSADQQELFQGKPLKPDWLVQTKDKLPPDFKQIVDPVGGGRWFAQEGAADVLNNYLTPGLRAKSGLYRVLVGVNNTMNQANLGLSAFHLTGEIIRSGVSRAALGIEDILNGNPIRGSLRIASFPAGPFLDMVKGSRVLHDYFKPGSEGAPISAITDALTKGGGRVGQPAEYSNQMVARMQAAFHSGNYVGGILRAPFALLEQTSKPMMEYLIPRLKLGVFHGMAQNELERLGPGASVEDARKAMASVWDSVDNRMGQIVYDNLFWHRTFKDLAHLMVRSVGWNLGTLREVGGGVTDLANLARGQKPEANHRIAYTLALPLVSGMIGAMYQYAHTGKGPQELKDYFFPKREDGSRITMPTDVKDVYHYATAPVRTIENKTGPLVNTLVEALHNRDYYDRPIRGEGDPFIKQLMEEADFIGRAFLPFTVQPMAGSKKGMPAQTPGQKAEGFLGFTRAPGDIQDNAKKRKAAKSAY